MANKHEKLSSDWRSWPPEMKARLLQRLKENSAARAKQQAFRPVAVLINDALIIMVNSAVDDHPR